MINLKINNKLNLCNIVSDATLMQLLEKSVKLENNADII